MIEFFLFILGACTGSFIGAYAYRYPRQISIAKGRSFCPHCKHQIYWFDNIPLVSFLLLKGRCRNCSKKISFREPLVELVAGIGFVSVYFLSLNFSFLNLPLLAQTVFLLFLFSALFAIFVTDIEEQIIPDEVVFLALTITFFALILSPAPDIWPRLLSGFAASSFLLLLNLITAGKGMGLGDVKLAILPGMVLGFPQVVIWLFVSFVLGAVVGIVLLLLGKAKMKSKIAFGPFLIVGFWLVLFKSEELARLLPLLYI